MASRIEYSEKYCDELNEYRHVILPKDLAKSLPKNRWVLFPFALFANRDTYPSVSAIYFAVVLFLCGWVQKQHNCARIS
jgi:hypothetical protein